MIPSVIRGLLFAAHPAMTVVNPYSAASLPGGGPT
jgi:hypothetical protein